MKAEAVKRWVSAARPRTLSISFVPLAVGTALASTSEATLDWWLTLSLFLCVPWIQIGMNLINDALDQKKGEMLLGTELASARWSLFSPTQFLWGGLWAFGVACLFAIPLLIAEGWPFAMLLILSLLLGYLYTGGPYPLSYTGTSEGFILIFYGVVATGVAEALHSRHISMDSLLAGIQIGLLAIVPHAINNLRDYVADARVNKRTLAVRYGTSFAKGEIVCCASLPFLLGILWIPLEKGAMALLPCLLIPLIWLLLKEVCQKQPSVHLTPAIARAAQCQLAFSCCLIAGIFWQ